MTDSHQTLPRWKQCLADELEEFRSCLYEDIQWFGLEPYAFEVTWKSVVWKKARLSTLKWCVYGAFFGLPDAWRARDRSGDSPCRLTIPELETALREVQEVAPKYCDARLDYALSTIARLLEIGRRALRMPATRRVPSRPKWDWIPPAKICEIRSQTALRRWIREHPNILAYARLRERGPGLYTLYLSDKETVKYRFDLSKRKTSTARYFPISLPEPRDARAWWEALPEGVPVERP